MTVRKRGSSYQADFMHKGDRYRETFDSHLEADQWEAEAKFNLSRGLAVPKPKNKRTQTGAKLSTLQELFDHVKRTHWDHMESEKSGKVLAFNAYEVVKILGPATKIVEVTKADLDEAYSEIVEGGNTNATANRKMAGISKMLTEAANNGIISRKPQIPKKEESEGRIRYITVEEETLITGLFASWGQFWLVDFTTIGIETGIRLADILRIEWRDISPDGKMLHVWKGKGKLNRSVPITKRCAAALKRLRETRGDHKGPFTDMTANGSLRTLWDRMRETLKFDDVTIHILRHTCASRLAQTPGINLQYVQKWLGHKDIKTTMRYAHLAPTTLDHCREALESYYETTPKTTPKDQQKQQEGASA